MEQLDYRSRVDETLPISTMHRDVISAYALTFCRVVAWLIVSAVVFRRYPSEYFAALSLLRWTIGLLAYTSVGLGPAMIHSLAQARHAGRSPDHIDRVKTVRDSGTVLAILAAAATLALTFAYRFSFPWLHHVPDEAMTEQFAGLILFFGLGDALRVLSEPAGAYLQTHDRITADNLILVLGEIAWAVLSLLSLPINHPNVIPVAAAFTVTSLGVCALRFLCTVDPKDPSPPWRMADRKIMLSLLAFGSFVLVSQLSDFLYAPTDMILINRLLSANDLAGYAPAVQIDTGLILLMTGLASVLLPKAASAHAAGDAQAVKRYYLLGTLWGGLLLLVVCVGTLAISKPLLRLWLHHPLPQTRAILPLVLINTAIGGSSAVGRSILLGMGRVRALSIAVLVAAITNVICSFCFVRYCNMGLAGIVLGTMVAVVGRCAIWMPWYVLRTLRRGGLPDHDAISTATLASPPV
ncbi:MAG: lipopolysaccharide biosynthesis protein [Phycisphaerae bacterium]|nr:lipopolysaccharide biosynthesis protein [Phycisphaerae bacterium]